MVLAKASKRGLSFFIFIFALASGIYAQKSPSGLLLLSELNYQNREVRQLRKEVELNLKNLGKGKPVYTVFRQYRIHKEDTFFSVMAKTMLDHDTLSSINQLSSLWDIEPGKVWLIPNVRGLAVFGKPGDIAKKYKIEPGQIFKVPGKKGFYFLPGRSLEPDERKFLNGTIFIKPVSGVISSGFGGRLDPFSKKYEFHKGIDIACPVGTKVIAAAPGKVIFSGHMSGYGNLIIIEHEHGYRTYYGHLNSMKVKLNQWVKQGERIGFSGKTGKVTGPHLHFEVRRKGQALFPKIRKNTSHGF